MCDEDSLVVDARDYLIGSAAFSFCASIYVLVMFYSVPHLQRHPNSLFRNKAILDIIAVCMQTMSMGRGENDCWCQETKFGEMVAFLTYACHFASETYTLFIGVDLILNMQSPFTNFQKNLTMYNIVALLVAALQGIALIASESNGKSLTGFCYITFHAGQQFHYFNISYMILVAGGSAIQVAAIVYVSRKVRARSEIQDIIFLSREKVIKTSFEYTMYYLVYWLVVIALWIGIFVDIEANVSTSNDIQGTTTETAVYALAFLQGLRSLPSLLLWLKWGHYLWHRIRDGDMTHVKDLKSQSMAPHLNESLRNELVKYMQFGLNATPNVQVKNDCRYIRIKYKKVEKTIRGSFKADMETFENIEKTSRCTDCMCPFRKRYRRRKRTSVIRGKWVMEALSESDKSTESADFKELMAHEFTRLRMQYGIENQYRKSLQNISAGKLTGGRSGSFFFFTKDHRFAIKTMDEKEEKVLRSLIKAPRRQNFNLRNVMSRMSVGSNDSVMPSPISSSRSSSISSSTEGKVPYVDYILKHRNESLIVKIFGAYELTMKDYGHKISFYIMENCFPEGVIMDEVYDIKGMGGEGAPCCPGPVLNRMSNPLKAGLVERCRFCRKVFRIGETEHDTSHYIWPDEVHLAEGEIVEFLTSYNENETKDEDVVVDVSQSLKRTRSFRRRASIGFQQGAWIQARVEYVPRRAYELLHVRTFEENTHLELDFASEVNIEIMPSQDRVTNNMWVFATMQFSKPPYSNGHDAVYDNVKAQIRRRWGFYAVNETNKPLLKRLAISRGQDPELSDPISNSILRMRHTLLYRIRRQIGGTTKWYSATRRFFEPNGRSRRISKKAQNSNNKERLAPRVALRLPHTVYVDTTSQKEIRIELPSNNASCNLTGFMWKTKGYVPNVRFSRCNKRRYHEPIQDLMEGDLKSKIELRPGEDIRIVRNIKRDSAFLMEHGIMDYSLLLGVHYKYSPNTVQGKTSKQMGLQSRYLSSKQYHLGIIDILKQFGMQKTIENFNKRYLLCRGDRISAVRPARYKAYFDDYMERNIFVTSTSTISRLNVEEEEKKDMLIVTTDLGLEEKQEEKNETHKSFSGDVKVPPALPPVTPDEKRKKVDHKDDDGVDIGLDGGVELMPV